MLWLAMLAKSESGTLSVQAPEYAPESSPLNVMKYASTPELAIASRF
jgi:hypothetical protein